MFDNQKNEVWYQLENHKIEIDKTSIKQLFKEDQYRFKKYSISFMDTIFDFSKNIINEQTLDLLIKLAESSDLKSKIDAMFTGEKINFTEKRAVLHTALRNMSDNPVFVDGHNVMPDVKNELEKAMSFAESVRNGIHKGFSGKSITDVVNIGIGGSHLGPDMVCTALSPYSGSVSVHFVSNVDPTDISEKLRNLIPETTLFLIASKTFTTQETMSNAGKAKEWFLNNSGAGSEAIAYHFAALSTNIYACKSFGIAEQNIFGFWDWVGGRYSVWSVIGLSVAISIGADNFKKFLNGAYQMDLHFRNSDFAKNIPVLMALIGVWYANFWGASTQAVIPYDQYLLKFSEFLQQLDMESNGKRINYSGDEVSYTTGPVIWGTIGTNSQHSFFQLLHQGTQMIPADFIAGINSRSGDQNQHSILLSNFFAQTEALMRGKNHDEVKSELEAAGLSENDINLLLPHKIFPGNKPTNTILYKELTPETLGMLIAIYEHKVFVQGVIWELNSYDQWGVELGKQLAKGILNDFANQGEINSHDASTNALINYYKDNMKV
ncbi:MAG: glucose-6-phosphate isomerase [Candidatus Kapabacteria bacterium]|nr:glucose-6-phosphate isomerase [Ignavibacteriota bacterium]MCW5884593.1 glucose-6-phosphate isomerase [Candidatus Kapabacteria bacterium]